MDQLYTLVSKARDMERDMLRFQAALQGHDLDKETKSQETKFEELRDKARAQALGVSVEEVALDGHFDIIEEE